MSTSNNDFVAMAKKICPVCGQIHSRDGEILIHTRLKNIPEKNTVIGTSLCEEHHKLFEDGYIALIGCEPDKSTVNENGNIDPNGAYRTGDVIHLREKVFVAFFDVTPPKGGVVFCTKEVIETLKNNYLNEITGE